MRQFFSLTLNLKLEAATVKIPSFPWANHNRTSAASPSDHQRPNMNVPGVGGVLPRLASGARLAAEAGRGYRPRWRPARTVSSFTGDGMKPMSQPSFTRRPIHQLLSYFSWNFDRWYLNHVYHVCCQWFMTWPLTMDLVRLKVAQKAMERVMIGVSLRDHVRNYEIRGRTNVSDKARSLCWWGHKVRKWRLQAGRPYFVVETNFEMRDTFILPKLISKE